MFVHRIKYRGSFVSALRTAGLAVFLAVGLMWVEGAAGQEVDVTDPAVLAAVSEAMSNPISSLIIFQTQFQWTQYKPPTGWTPPPGVVYPSDGEVGFQFQLIPTVPVPLGSKLNLISRMGIPFYSSPFSSDLNGVVAHSGSSDNIIWEDLPTIEDPTQTTNGMGDMWYLGLVAPRAPIAAGSGTLLVAAGPTLMMPTASEPVLGLGKWSSGPGALLGWTSPKWMFAMLGMQFWDFAGDEDRAGVSMTTVQAFYYYNFNAKWSVGASPMAQFNWESSSGNKVTFPIGMGINNTSFWGKLPVRTGLEIQYAAIAPDDLPGSRWIARLSIIPVIPAPWGDLAKALKGSN
jgi:hypothetical protein